jgi:hypothetical protein
VGGVVMGLNWDFEEAANEDRVRISRVIKIINRFNLVGLSLYRGIGSCIAFLGVELVLWFCNLARLNMGRSFWKMTANGGYKEKN